MNKTKIFVSAYACEPELGSEIGVGWHWILEMSKYFELWVLTRKSNQSRIESWLKKNEIQLDIHFVYFDLPKSLRFWKKGRRGVRIYYTIWQKLTNKIVKKTMSANDIHIYHLLTYGNSLWPASKYGMKQFFIWGPTGGVDTIPKEYSKHYGIKSRLIEFVRRMIVTTLPLNYGFHQRCKKSNLIFCKSYHMYYAIPEKYREKALIFTDVAVELREFQYREKEQAEKTKYIVVGNLDAWRAFDVLVQAFTAAYQINKDIELEIVGKGNDENRIKLLIKQNKMEDSIHMCGEIDMDEYFDKMNNADVIINSSLKEGAVTVSFDSMALSKPLICVDTGGYTRYFNNNYSIVLKREGRQKLIQDMTKAILKMTDKNLREEFGKKAHAAGEEYTWENKGKEIYREIVKKYKGDV